MMIPASSAGLDSLFVDSQLFLAAKIKWAFIIALKRFR